MKRARVGPSKGEEDAGLYFDELEMNAFEARARALAAARRLSRELSREVGELERFWYEMRQR